MGKEKFKSMQNPLLMRKEKPEIKEVTPIQVEDKLKFIYKYGRTTSVSENLLNFIDYDDRKFINRFYENTDELYNEDMEDLVESIKEIGLLNTVYLIEKDADNGKKFAIVSGLRRLLAIKKLVENNEEIREVNKVVIFREDTPYELLNRMSIDENTKRKDLTVLELSYKLRKDAKENKKSIEDLMDEHKLNRRKFFRLTKVMDYPLALRNVVDEIGINKAETINKIYKYKKSSDTIESITNYCKNLSERELDAYYKEISKKEKKLIEIKINSKNTEVNIKIKKKVNSDLMKLIEEFQEKLENFRK